MSSQQNVVSRIELVDEANSHTCIGKEMQVVEVNPEMGLNRFKTDDPQTSVVHKNEAANRFEHHSIVLGKGSFGSNPQSEYDPQKNINRFAFD